MSIKAELLKNSVAFSISCSRWGNLRRANKEEVQTGADKDMLRLSKKLVDSKEYEAIVKIQNRIRKWIEDNSVPSFFHRGVFLIATNTVNDVEKYLERAKGTMKDMVEEFIQAYREQIIDAKEKLGPQFNQGDYPSPEYLRNSFDISWKWISFDVPQNLPDEVFKAEREKAEKIWAEATENVKQCLRTSFMKLIAHAKEKLTVAPGEKPKVFRDSLMNNIEEFLNTFNNRNIVNDKDLEELVGQTRGLLANPKSLRTDVSLRAKVAQEFENVSKTLDKMIIKKPSRRFCFDD